MPSKGTDDSDSKKRDKPSSSSSDGNSSQKKDKGSKKRRKVRRRNDRPYVEVEYEKEIEGEGGSRSPQGRELVSPSLYYCIRLYCVFTLF